MDAKTLHAFISEQGLFPAAESYRFAAEYEQAQRIILSALSLAAAVEGPEEATPETDAFVRKLEEQIRANNANNVPMQDPASQAIDAIADMERQRNAALRALKAERERANKLADLLRVHDRLDAIAAQEDSR